MLNLHVPVLHHTGAPIARGQISDSTKTTAASAIILSRIEVGRRGKARNPRIEKQCGTKASIKTGRGCKAIRQGLAEIAVSEGRVINAIASANHRLSKFPEQSFGRVCETNAGGKIPVIGSGAGRVCTASAWSCASKDQSTIQWDAAWPNRAGIPSSANVRGIRVEN